MTNTDIKTFLLESEADVHASLLLDKFDSKIRSETSKEYSIKKKPLLNWINFNSNLNSQFFTILILT